jgi:menaquinone-dependent protoporphyrinogen oxidase
MRVLVTVASKHGATGEIGEIIAGVLRDAGMEVESHPPEAVRTLEGTDAVVLGSAIYAGRWLEPARAFAKRHADGLVERPVWLFSSGPIGDPPMPAEEPTEPLALAQELGAREHRIFAGRLDRSQLGFMERTITRALKAAEGDFRDLDAIRGWADGIAAELHRTRIPTVAGR